jgi:hypothetical protein
VFADMTAGARMETRPSRKGINIHDFRALAIIIFPCRRVVAPTEVALPLWREVGAPLSAATIAQVMFRNCCRIDTMKNAREIAGVG